MAEHTPGPWLIEKNYSNGCEIGPWIMTGRRPSGERNIIANIAGAPYLEADKGANTYANARLVTAAPDLLEALQEVVAISDRKHNAWDKAHAAIAKATG
jgi:hypothetical protein